METPKLLIFVLALLTACCYAKPQDFKGKMYGVNIGGWMVLERFITPLLLDKALDERINDEYTLCQYKGNDSVIREKLRNHWETFVQDDDLMRLARNGITHLRVPVGYWSLETQEELDSYGDPYIPGAWTYFERTMPIFKKYNLKVIVDLHGAPGSQNGFDNSGRTCEPQWGTGDTINRTLKVIERLAKRLAAFDKDAATSDTIVGIELMNEAFPPRLKGGIQVVKDYYLRAYPVVRKHMPADKYWVVIEQAFTTTSWIDFMNGSEYENVLLDVHFYQVFDAGMRGWTDRQHLSHSCGNEKRVLALQTLPTFVGEWAIAWKEESNNAYMEPYPAREDIEFIQRFFLAQTNAWEERGIGWYYWNFKTYNASMWDYLVGVRDRWFPSHPNNLVKDGCNLDGPPPVIPDVTVIPAPQITNSTAQTEYPQPNIESTVLPAASLLPMNEVNSSNGLRTSMTLASLLIFLGQFCM